MSGWDEPSKSAQLTRDLMPAKNGSVRRLQARVDELEKRIKALEVQPQEDT